VDDRGGEGSEEDGGNGADDEGFKTQEGDFWYGAL